MHWNGKDSAVFQAQKEYIDTAVIPLTLIDGSDAGISICSFSCEFYIVINEYD